MTSREQRVQELMEELARAMHADQKIQPILMRYLEDEERATWSAAGQRAEEMRISLKNEGARNACAELRDYFRGKGLR